MLDSNQLSRLLALAQDAAREVMDIYNQTSLDASPGQRIAEVSQKADDSPVTKADLLAHRTIVEGLAKIAPEIPVVSEEDPESLAHRKPDGLFWLIDPLDGTKEFISRNGEFTVNIALIENGLPVFGIVLAPSLDLLYWGGPAIGAFRKQGDTVEQIRLTDPAGGSGAIRVVASRSHMNRETSDFIEQLGTTTLVQAGSSLKLCRIAEGSADVYPRMGPTSEWDTAAAQAIVEAAGGYVCTSDGESLRYGKPDVLNPYFIAAGKRLPRNDLAKLTQGKPSEANQGNGNEARNDR